MPDLSGIPLVGTTLPVVFPKGGRIEQPAMGSWVKMRNLGARVVNGQLQVGATAAGAARVQVWRVVPSAATATQWVPW